MFSPHTGPRGRWALIALVAGSLLISAAIGAVLYALGPGSQVRPTAAHTTARHRLVPSRQVQDDAFCLDHECIPSFWEGSGYIVECADGEWSHSGGRPGACSYHGGESGTFDP